MAKNLQTTSINVNQNQLLAAQLLAAGKSGKVVAEIVGVTEETVSRWKQDNDFQLYMTDLLTEAHETARVRLQNLASKAIDNIEAILCDPSMSPKDKFVVSLKVLELCNGYNYTLQERAHAIRNPSPFEF